LTSVDVSGEMAGWALKWLSDPLERRKASEALASLRDRVAIPGASDRAAERIIGTIEGNAAEVFHKGPHDPSKLPKDDRVSAVE
jgi:hypothetical protein